MAEPSEHDVALGQQLTGMPQRDLSTSTGTRWTTMEWHRTLRLA